MLYGAMNNPMIDPVEEIQVFADQGFDFIDLTLEPEETYPSTMNIKRVVKALDETKLGVVGHTAWYLPIASPYPEMRELAIKELEKCLRVFRDLGVERMNVHPQVKVPLHNDDWIISQNIDGLTRLVNTAAKFKMKIMLENMPHYSRVSFIKPILDAVPEAEMLLDVGHANLDHPYNRSEELLANFGSRLGHVHVSDNRGGRDDEHLPLGVGSINWLKIVQKLKQVGYDRTVTIEVFGDDEDYLVISRDKFKRLWEMTDAPA